MKICNPSYKHKIIVTQTYINNLSSLIPLASLSTQVPRRSCNKKESGIKNPFIKYEKVFQFRMLAARHSGWPRDGSHAFLNTNYRFMNAFSVLLVAFESPVDLLSAMDTFF